jgi:hypothetical protein
MNDKEAKKSTSARSQGRKCKNEAKSRTYREQHQKNIYRNKSLIKVKPVRTLRDN